MAGHLHRTQILLEPEQHQALAEIAAREGRSVSDVVREMVRQYLQEEQQPTALPAVGDVSAERIDAIWRQYEQERQRAAHTSVEARLAVLQRIRKHQEEMTARREGKPVDFDVVGEINRMREERDAEILASLNDHSN